MTQLSLILRDVIIRGATIYIPDSDCGVTKTVIMLLSCFGLRSRINLIPDGYITSKPLKLQSTGRPLHRPVSADEVMRQLAAIRQSEEKAHKRIAPCFLVSIKRSFDMPESAAFRLAQSMLHDAAHELTLSGNHKRQTLHVAIHRTFSRHLLDKLIDTFQRERQSVDMDESVRITPVNYAEISLDSVVQLYSLPSTVIWELWDVNPSAALHLYDPVKSGWLPPGHWIQDISGSLDVTRALAKARGAVLQSSYKRSDRLIVEIWKIASQSNVTPRETSQS
jgi:hypothetical protein